MTQPIALPTIHPGGTDPWRLIKDYAALGDHVAQAKKALSFAPCYGEDFPDDPEGFQQAQADRREMFRLLEMVQNYAEQWQARACG